MPNLNFWINFISFFWEEIFEIIIVLIPVIFAFLFILFEVRNTFKAQRKENTRQFLHHAQLESVKEILQTLDKAYWLILQASADMRSDRFTTKQSEGRYLHSTHEASLEMDSIDLYIDFIPELKEQFLEVKEKMRVAKKETRIRYEEQYEEHIHLMEIAAKQRVAIEGIEDFRKNVILVYGNKINMLTEKTKI